MAADAASRSVTVTDAPDASRFELRLDGELAGIARYARRPGRIVFVHTEIDDRFEGQGLGGRLIAGALDAARAAGERVVPRCPFVAAYIERHPEYDDLVDDASLARLAQHREG